MTGRSQGAVAGRGKAIERAAWRCQSPCPPDCAAARPPPRFTFTATAGKGAAARARIDRRGKGRGRSASRRASGRRRLLLAADPRAVLARKAAVGVALAQPGVGRAGASVGVAPLAHRPLQRLEIGCLTIELMEEYADADGLIELMSIVGLRDPSSPGAPRAGAGGRRRTAGARRRGAGSASWWSGRRACS